MELVKPTPGSLEAVKIQADIDDYKLPKKRKSDAFDDAFSQLQKSVCFVKLESSPPEKKP